MNEMKDIYLKKLFRAYYKTHAKEMPIPSSFSQREFAFLYWTKKGMIRHIQYPSPEILQHDLIINGPRHCYHGASYYKHPGADNMDDKGYYGCDFVADIDADHIPTPCRDHHNYSICKGCGVQFPGDNPEECPKCGAKKFNKIIWICDECLEVSKQQVFHLIDNFLIKDFGIPLEDIQIYFSGHRGYHIHVETEVFRSLDQDARREMCDYFTGDGFSNNVWSFKKFQGHMNGFQTDQPGWPGKIAQELQLILMQGESNVRDVLSPYVKPNLISTLLENRSFLINQLNHKNKSWQIKGLGDAAWYSIFDVLKNRIKADIDVVVSIDLHRLIRLEGSLHGKAGFVVKELKYEDLQSFDPLQDALAFPHNPDNKISLKITIPICPKIKIANEEYGPFVQDEKIYVPLNVGIFLLCKDVADLIAT